MELINQLQANINGMHNPPPPQKPELPIWLGALIGAGGTLLLFLVGLGIWNLINSRFSFKDISAVSVSTSFPQVYCGDKVPSQTSNRIPEMYPVYIGYSDTRLEEVQKKLCQNSVKQESQGVKKIQLATFNNVDRARAFQSYLKSSISDIELGEAIVLEASFSGTQKIDVLCDKAKNFYEVIISSSGCPQDLDKDGYIDKVPILVTFTNTSKSDRTITFKGAINFEDGYFNDRGIVPPSSPFSPQYQPILTSVKLKPNQSFIMKEGASQRFFYSMGIGKPTFQYQEVFESNLKCQYRKIIDNGENLRAFGINGELKCFDNARIDFFTNAGETRIVTAKAIYQDIEWSYMKKINSGETSSFFPVTFNFPPTPNYTYNARIYR